PKTLAFQLIYLLLIPTRLVSRRRRTSPLRRSPRPPRAATTSAMAPKKDKAPPPSSKPAKSGGGKQKKKKWSKGKQKEKVNNAVLFDQATYDKLLSEVPKYKQITPSVLSERLRINGSLARRAIKDLMARGLIRMVNNAVLFDQATYDKLLSEVPKYKQITPSVLSEHL
ncbi:unnamed protein product, partial [Urochloa humidicola]